ncbi:hypothetical protein C8F04DRAFT_1189458 [Mycena alexandri]|uniref:Uncharacterized protein n=1 Tax=Mycena alexandri TaxID=1745969 RepID=A0AAD6SIH8_9AGAR|nr:hypothetical protein C8F04DRAFT_1189458 [Mycena alexandri]
MNCHSTLLRIGGLGEIRGPSSIAMGSQNVPRLSDCDIVKVRAVRPGDSKGGELGCELEAQRCGSKHGSRYAKTRKKAASRRIKEKEKTTTKRREKDASGRKNGSTGENKDEAHHRADNGVWRHFRNVVQHTEFLEPFLTPKLRAKIGAVQVLNPPTKMFLSAPKRDLFFFIACFSGGENVLKREDMFGPYFLDPKRHEPLQ